MFDHHQVMEEAESFIKVCYGELGKEQEETEKRLLEIKAAIKDQGFYEHSFEELQHGAKMAWRNSNRCIGRFYWDILQVFDARKVESEADMVQALYRHIEYATNGGRIRPAIPFLNKQRIRSIQFEFGTIN